jgi:hypothetical protein
MLRFGSLINIRVAVPLCRSTSACLAAASPFVLCDDAPPPVCTPSALFLLLKTLLPQRGIDANW